MSTGDESGRAKTPTHHRQHYNNIQNTRFTLSGFCLQNTFKITFKDTINRHNGTKPANYYVPPLKQRTSGPSVWPGTQSRTHCWKNVAICGSQCPLVIWSPKTHVTARCEQEKHLQVLHWLGCSTVFYYYSSVANKVTSILLFLEASSARASASTGTPCFSVSQCPDGFVTLTEYKILLR